MKNSSLLFSCLIVVLGLLLSSCAPSASVIKSDTGSPDPVMGDWQGHIVGYTGFVEPIVLQAIALGGDRYRFNVGSKFDTRETGFFNNMSFEVLKAGAHFIPADSAASKEEKDAFLMVMDDGVISGKTAMKEAVSFLARKVTRLSPNLKAKPPAGAIVLFDGTSLDAWESRDVKKKGTPAAWKLTQGAMEVMPGTGDIVTKQKFTDFRLHVEFRSPFMPEAKGQARGNSGVYLQGRYEVQVLDSYGLSGEDNECGGIYKVAKPRVNMCAPPMQWQSYDITFHAPRFDKDGKKIKDALLTVSHNGVSIHEDLTIPGLTGGAVDDDVKLPGGILFQDHGNLVQYRNIWLVELKNSR
ncbi:MAG: DUF1080 domain-containing protein [bacterium]